MVPFETAASTTSSTTSSPIRLTDDNADVVAQVAPANPLVAQAASSSTTTSGSSSQFDLTPVKLPVKGGGPGQFNEFRTGFLSVLPPRMYFNASCENSLRLETNVLQTSSRNHSDMIYRVLPNVTAGYALTRSTRIAANYFFFRDQYMDNSNLLSRNIHSIGPRVEQDVRINPKTSVTFTLFPRWLFIHPAGFSLFDILPSATVVRRVGDKGLIYGSALGQIRFRDTFDKYQEGDVFYSLGGIYRTPKWTFLWDNTFITNFGKPALRGGVANNQTMIMTLEADRKVHPKLPLTAFVRAEPVFNIGQEKRTGFAGVNFRLFGGLRADISKPVIYPVKLRGLD